RRDSEGAYPSRDFRRGPRISYLLSGGPSLRGVGRPMAIEVAGARRRFTREEYHWMAEVGILKPTDRVELIRGEIIEMSPPGRRDVAFVNNLNRLLVLRLGERAIVSVRNPVALTEDTEPQPDLAICRERAVR